MSNQITSEQILLEAYERKDQPLNKTKVSVADLEELQELQRRKRQEYEDALRRNRLDIRQWMRYAQFEIEQNDMQRARSIFERALEINSHHVPLWIRYIDSELKNRNINHARNLFQRATELLPRIDKIWFKYVQTEEFLQNIQGTRIIFNKWIKWEPDSSVWDAFINFEKRYDEYDNVRKIFNKYVIVHPIVETWIKWSQFEINFGDSNTVRQVFNSGIDLLGYDGGNYNNSTNDENSSKLIVQYAKFEANICKEFERARSIYKFGLTKFPQSSILRNDFTIFESQFGDKDGIELSIIANRMKKYETQLVENPRDYDTWWLYLTTIQDQPIETQRLKFKESYKIQPSSNTKNNWKRYIFLFIRHAIWEEFHGEVEKVEEIFQNLTNLLKINKLNFSKIWILYSNFAIRQNNLIKARKLLGFALGTNPTSKIFKHYIELEIKLKEFDRVRQLYNKYLENFPENIEIWIKFSQLEYDLNDLDRSRAIYKLGLEIIQDDNGREKLFDNYIEFEFNLQNYGLIRDIFNEKIELDKITTKNWINFANWEVNFPTQLQIDKYQENLIQLQNDDEELEFEYDILEESKERAREIWEQALKFYKSKKLIDERIIIYKAYESFEKTYGNNNSLTNLQKRLPTPVKKIANDQEYIDYIFPDDAKFLKFLQNAKKWANDNNNGIKK
ncbi:hypothetical protein WICMUC_000746 [Wickerhamomyces mucosus]|uniref:Pre-mRNA-splicing factor CLF1 n=1 Tax=Wickerhamomyces mucosus TaxID=1378264 RepID=A0A9P8TIC3_9ASCO|nr:hypothetical protein WICMUC_000746 [Wickerhamomyces mucosus]